MARSAFSAVAVGCAGILLAACGTSATPAKAVSWPKLPTILPKSGFAPVYFNSPKATAAAQRTGSEPLGSLIVASSAVATSFFSPGLPSAPSV